MELDDDRKLKAYVEEQLDIGKKGEFTVARLVRKGVALERARLAVRIAEDEHLANPEARDERNRERRPFSRTAAVEGFIACFVLCWLATIVLTGLSVGGHFNKLAGTAVGAFMTGWSKESKFNGVRIGSAIGWGAYLATMAAIWANTHYL